MIAGACPGSRGEIGPESRDVVTEPTHPTVERALDMDTVHTLISELRARRGIAVIDQRRSVTGTELAAEVEHLAASLSRLGLGSGHAALIRMGNSIDSIVTLLAVLRCGGVAYIGNPYDPAERVAETVARFVPHIMFADMPSALLAQARMGELGAEVFTLEMETVCAVRFAANGIPLSVRYPALGEAGLAIFSSGTTGEPKAIMHAIERVFMNARLHAEAIGLRSDDVVGCVLPIYFSYGLVANLFASLLIGATVAIHEKSATVNGRWLEDSRVSVLGLTPYFADRLETESQHLRLLTFGGDALSARTGRSVMARFPNCEHYATYGLTEAGPRVATWRLEPGVFDRHEIAPLGRPLRGVGLELRDAEGRATDHGELVVNTPTRMLGYVIGVEQGHVMPAWPQGEVHTGDIYQRIDGEIFFAGRMKEIIVQSGEKIYPLAIELVIQGIPGVIDVRVDAVPDARKGHIARAVIHANGMVDQKMVRKALLQRFSSASLPEQIEFVESIPRTHTGKKVRRRQESAAS